MSEIKLKTKEEVIETMDKFVGLCYNIAKEYSEVEFIGPEIMLKKPNTSFNILLSIQTYELIKDLRSSAIILLSHLNYIKKDLKDDMYLLSQIEDGLSLLALKISNAMNEIELEAKRKPESVCKVTMGAEDICGLAGFWATFKFVEKQIDSKLFGSS